MTNPYERQDYRNLRSLDSKFVIPVGSQVVIQVDRPIVNSKTFKKAGSVGVVIKIPSANNETYLIQFSDELVVEARIDQIVLRRAMVDSLLSSPQDEAARLKEFVIYRCQVGSKAFGLSTESSDDDIRGIFLPTATRHWSLYKLPEQLEFQDDERDEVFWELEKFLRLALKANPNILETLWTEIVLEADPIAEKLLIIRSAFLSRHIHKTYSGYVISQFRRMTKSFEKTGAFKTKHAMHLIRLLYSGIEAIRTGRIQIDVGEHREELLAIRHGHFTFEEIRKKAFSLDREFQKAFATTDLPEHPDFETVNDYLIDARRSRT
ncbi:MAG: nucleotidyltransferase domain-containing protein [Planctomycetota bacterium]